MSGKVNVARRGRGLKKRRHLNVNMTATLDLQEPAAGVEIPTRATDRRRFTTAVVVGAVVVAVPYLWNLTDLWNHSPSLLRTVLPTIC